MHYGHQLSIVSPIFSQLTQPIGGGLHLSLLFHTTEIRSPKSINRHA